MRSGKNELIHRMRTSCGVMLALAMVFMMANAVFSQGQKPASPQLQKKKWQPIATVRLSPDAFRVEKKPPLQFKPLAIEELKNPKTGQRIDPKAVVSTGRGMNPRAVRVIGGRPGTGEQLQKDMDTLERLYNAKGYTLRRNTTDRRIIRYGQPNLDRGLLNRQLEDAKKFKPLPPNMKFVGGMKQPMLFAQFPVQSQIKVIVPPQKPTIRDFNISSNQVYSKVWGEKKYLAAEDRAEVKISANKDRVTAFAESKVSVYVFNEEIKLLGATGYVEAEQAGGGKTRVSVTAWGDDLIQDNGEKKGPQKARKEKSFGKSTECPVFSLGPFEIVIDVGCEGSAGADYDLSFNNGVAWAQVTPFVSVKSYVECGIELDLKVASVEFGVGGNLTLLEYQTPVTVAVSNQLQNAEAPYVGWQWEAAQTITACKGDFYVYAEVDTIVWDDRWEYEIFKWDGIVGCKDVIPKTVFTVSLVGEQKVEAHQGVSDYKKYAWTIYTSKKDSAGTDANVKLTLIGDKGRSEDAKLAGRFEKGSKDDGFIQAKDLGDLKRIRLQHDNKNEKPGWYVDKVIVKEGNHEWEFPVKRWLARDEGDKKIDIEVTGKRVK